MKCQEWIERAIQGVGTGRMDGQEVGNQGPCTHMAPAHQCMEARSYILYI